MATTNTAESVPAELAACRLIYVTDSAPGISRVRRGRGLSYHHPHGRRVERAEVLTRIRSLAIPPAWEAVWICCDARGHLQATGRDGGWRVGRRAH